ncbi:ATP-dependent DNA helicase DinG [Thalassobacillus sp. CUG 92003]|uniref:ATP-dependent DNA helicase DinG n=1 Tax=Thalassobacillus sp. CUG 92003 TaxID=2736641 RepID=UPI0015E70233|nr:ATP-dependent DNA helicase DinG [Thalassobacillus sp. CUG 92003]
MARYTIVDLETTGNAPAKGDRIIEIGIVTMEDHEVIEEFSSLVFPESDIPAFISGLTGIQDDDVQGAPLFYEIVDDVYRMFKNSYVVAHNIQFDLGFLNAELNRCGYASLGNPVLDTVEMARMFLPSAPSFKLGQLAEQLCISHQNPHRALSDAQVTGDLLMVLFDKMNQLPEETLAHLLRVERKLKSDLHELLESEMLRKRYSHSLRNDVQLFHGMVIKASEDKVPSRIHPLSEFNTFKQYIFHEETGLRSIFPNFEYRESQELMVQSIHDALTSSRHALIEAETGTGKSLAYLLPAVHYAVNHQERILITTHTTHLQRQLLENEIPQVETLLNRPIKVALMKGKSHYISVLRFSQQMEDCRYDNYDTALTKAMILVWLTETTSGDADEIQLPSNGRYFWSKISTEQEENNELWADYNRQSFYRKARGLADEAHLIVTNHTVFCMDLTNQFPMLPAYDRVIIDEGHHLVTTASKHFGLQFDYVALQSYFSHIMDMTARNGPLQFVLHQPDIQAILTTIERQLESAKESLDELFRYLFKMAKHKKRGKSDIGRIQYVFDVTRENPKNMDALQEMTQQLLAPLRDVTRQLELLFYKMKPEVELREDVDGSATIGHIERHRDRLLQMIARLESYFLEAGIEHVKWFEIEANGAENAVFLYSEPLDISIIMKEQLFDKKESVILTSATLTMKQSFQYIRRQLGMHDQAINEFKYPSPYPMDQQVNVMVPTDFPDIKDNQEEFIHATCEAIYSLAHITEGRMLVLFTSYEMLKKAYYLLRDIMEEDDYLIFAQGISSGSRDRLKKNFQSFNRAILLGTSSFWEGVDIPGEDLTCLMIVRLPFQPPDHPVANARSHVLKEAGHNPFMELSLPQAVIRFKQGFGRLIRSSSDRGIVFVCDQRLMKARYGKYFLNSIPDVPVHHKTTHQLIQETESWLT